MNAQLQTTPSPVTLIGVACCAGAKDQRCNIGPELLLVRHAEQSLATRGVRAQWHGTLRPAHPEHSYLNQVVDVCTQTAAAVRACVERDERFAVIGGDHSCAIGTWSGAATALRSRGPMGLIWIDAHMDSHTPDTSPSDALHGMPLASLLGYGYENLTQVASRAPKLAAPHVCLIGVRSYEPEEAALLARLGVRVVFMREVRERGLSVVMREALQLVTRDTAGFGITIDLDAIDPVDAPGVGSPEPGGILARELLDALAPLKMDPHLLGVEIAELNPFRDRNDKTAQLTLDLLTALL